MDSAAIDGPSLPAFVPCLYCGQTFVVVWHPPMAEDPEAVVRIAYERHRRTDCPWKAI